MSEVISLNEFFKRFPDEQTATDFVEKKIWQNGAYCPHCGSYEVTKCNSKKSPMPYRCRKCRKFFSVRIGTIFNESHLPFQKWLLAIYILTNCKKGVSSIYLSEQLGCTQKTAWFLAHRIRETWNNMSPKLFGIVEVDEVYLGGKKSNKHASKKIKSDHLIRGKANKLPVVGIKSRDGKVKTMYIERANAQNLIKAIEDNVMPGTKVFTDQNTCYNSLEKYYHESVNHSKGEYVRGIVHTNSIESYWAILRRGYYGIYHFWSINHLHRYISEFEERFNMRKLPTFEKLIISVKGALNKRLTYKELINVPLS